jgi:hypothetical protein
LISAAHEARVPVWHVRPLGDRLHYTSTWVRTLRGAGKLRDTWGLFVEFTIHEVLVTFVALGRYIWGRGGPGATAFRGKLAYVVNGTVNCSSISHSFRR